MLLGIACSLHSTDAPTWQDDSRQLAALADSIGMPLSEHPTEPFGDDVLLDLLDMA